MVQFKILSYNIWFDRFLREPRLKSLISKILAENPCVVCLQEVIDFTHGKLLTNLLTEYKYSYPENLNHRYGCLILSKYPIEKATSLKFKSNMGRQLDLAYIRLPSNRSIVIANTHFESEFEVDNKTKISQYKYTTAVLNKIFNDNVHDKNFLGTILCADTNITKHDEIKYNLSLGTFCDAWNKDQSKENTYDTKTNILLSESKNQFCTRLDRILYNSNNGLKQTSFDMLKGDQLEISDHYGISASFDAHKKIDFIIA